MKVPIQNLYYLLCYAWGMLEEGRVLDVSSEPFQSLPDLFARVLRTGVSHQLRRGLDRGYISNSEDIRAPRGKFDLATTAKRNLRVQGRVQCEFDEFRADVLQNQIIKATLLRLARCDEMDRKLRECVVDLLHRLHEISSLDLTSDVFDRIVIHRNNRFYKFLIEVCRILYQSLLVNHSSGRSSFRDFLHDEEAMARLFERFVRNFYRCEQSEFKCQSESLEWTEVSCEPEAFVFLPKMRTDVTLRSSNRTIVLDTKYYASCLQSHKGKDTIHSGHLYQLFAYLKNTSFSHVGSVEGILLYPTIERPLDLRYQIQDHSIRVATIDLNVPWIDIRNRLLKMIHA